MSTDKSHVLGDSGHVITMSTDKSHEVDDPALDFLSVSFDPLKALQTSPSKVELPHPAVQPCDNLDTYTSGTATPTLATPTTTATPQSSHTHIPFPSLVVRGTRQDPRPATPPTGGADKAAMDTSKITTKHIKTVFDFMERTDAGPFTLLQTCRSEERRVRVTVRHCVGVRGVCEGTVLVYDRHMNIVLTGVTEWCTPFRTVSNGGILCTKRRKKLLKRTLQSNESPLTSSQSSKDPHTHTSPQSTFAPLCKEESSKEKWEMCRTIKQLFIRGDNIIHVTML